MVVAAPAAGLLIGAILESILAAVLITAAIIALDRLGDEIRKRGVLLHVRDETLVRLAERCNNGAQIAGAYGKMAFVPYNPISGFLDIQAFWNFMAHNGTVYIGIKSGLWDARTMMGIGTFIANCPGAAGEIARDPSLGKPSRKPALIVSAPKGSPFASFFGSGINVEYLKWPRFFDKQMVTIPPEKVGRGKYMVFHLR